MLQNRYNTHKPAVCNKYVTCVALIRMQKAPAFTSRSLRFVSAAFRQEITKKERIYSREITIYEKIVVFLRHYTNNKFPAGA